MTGSQMSARILQSRSFVLVTAAYNEEAFIERTVQSVVAQTHKPLMWIIVSDGSVDQTDDIVSRYAARFGFIRLLRITEEHPRNFAAQVNAINRGIGLLRQTAYDFIGNLDADISLEPNYFERLLDKFSDDEELGLGGGFIYERNRSGQFVSRPNNSCASVAHAVQMFRRECFDSIGGYVPLSYGGPDALAETMARLHGWRVEAFPEFKVNHYRATGGAGGRLRSAFRQGRMDYSLGYHPIFEIARLLRRIWTTPYVIGAAIRAAGFTYCYCRGEMKQVSDRVMYFERSRQLERLRSSLRPPFEIFHR